MKSCCSNGAYVFIKNYCIQIYFKKNYFVFLFLFSNCGKKADIFVYFNKIHQNLHHIFDTQLWLDWVKTQPHTLLTHALNTKTTKT